MNLAANSSNVVKLPTVGSQTTLRHLLRDSSGREKISCPCYLEPGESH